MLYDSADIIRRVKLRLNRPTVDEALADADLYDFATEAQDDITKRLAIYSPDALWPAPTALTSSDGGATFTFGTDTDSAAIFALGKFRVYATLDDIPDEPLTEGVDYTTEGTKIRTPNNDVQSSPDGGPWSQYVAPSNVISAAVQPTIPKMARLALISKTAAKAASRLRLTDLAGEQEQQYEIDWSRILETIRTQSWGKGGLPVQQRRGRWWRGDIY